MSNFGSTTFAPMRERMDNNLLCKSHLDAYLRELPIAAAVLPRLQALLLSDDYNVSDVVEMVRIDPALAARVMQASSSVYFGGRKVDSLDEGLARLGFREAYRIVSAFALTRFVNAPLRIYGIAPAEYWRRSVACALVMEQYAWDRGLDDRVAYTVGLLHQLGMIFIDRHLRALAADGFVLRDQPNSPIPRQEMRLTGMHQAQIAAMVLRGWGFGEAIVEPIEWQFDPSRCVAHGATATALVEARAVAIALVAALPEPGSKNKVILREGAEAWEREAMERILALESTQIRR